MISLLTRYAEVVQCHAIEVWIGVTAGNSPFKRVLDILNWFPKVLPQLASMRPDLFSDKDVSEGCEVVVAVSLQNQLVLEYMWSELSTYGLLGIVGIHPGCFPFSLISSGIFFVHEIFHNIDPVFLPSILSEVFELESRMKD
jgi:hypothetical protein